MAERLSLASDESGSSLAVVKDSARDDGQAYSGGRSAAMDALEARRGGVSSGVMGSRELTGVVLKAGLETGSRDIVGGVGGRALPGSTGDVRGGMVAMSCRRVRRAPP